jgi:peptidoglycan/LPS O-acetylase OafA/YrhL
MESASLKFPHGRPIVPLPDLVAGVCVKLNYLTPLDGIRAVAMLLVFAAHAGLDNIVPGGLGVTIFFFLSGFLITSLLRAEWDSLGTISLRGFYLRRAVRILPPLYLALVIFGLLDLAPGSHHHNTLRGLGSILFYLFNYAPALHIRFEDVPTGLTVAWSLMVEEHFYLLFPCVYVLFRRRALSRKVVTLILGSACVAALFWRGMLVYGLHLSLASKMPWTYMATDARFDSILWGCMLAIGANPWCGDRPAWLMRRKGILAVGSLLLMLSTLVVRDPGFRQTMRYSLQGIALLPLFFYVTASPDARAVRWLTWRPLRWFGWVSYTFYLVHMGVLLKLHTYTHWSALTIGIVGFVLSCAVAQLVRITVELPLQRRRKLHAPQPCLANRAASSATPAPV